MLSLAIAYGGAPYAQAQSGEMTPERAAQMRGDALYQQMCAACHGLGGEGGPGGAANLVRSTIAQTNDAGVALGGFLAVGRPDKGMPPFPLSQQQNADLAAALRALGTTSTASADAPRDTADVVLVGDIAAGRAYFNGPVGQCSSCHSVTDGETSAASNLSRIGAKYPDPKTLQNNMVLNRTFFWSPTQSNDITATVVWADGREVSGLLSSVSDFRVVVRDASGVETVIERRNGEPRVTLVDRMQHHLDMLRVYRDSDMHDLTAYLWTLR